MQIKFKVLNLTNFKCHKDLEVKFGDLTKILADNYQGKSSIGEAITWLLYGTDAVGSKLDPTPVTYEADETTVSLLLNVDGKELLIGRGLKKGKAQYYVNEVPSKAGEFNEILDQLFDKDLFLSLFNPNYFFTLHWEKQREMILRYITPPANKEVFKELPKPQSEKLSVLVKKHLLEQLERIHRENKTKQDKQYIAAQSRTKTLKEQLEQQAPTVPLESLQAELGQLVKERNSIEEVTDKAQTSNSRMNVLNSKVASLTEQIDYGKNDHANLKKRELDLNCHACGQEITENAKKITEQFKTDQLKQIAERVNPLINTRKDLREELAGLEYVDVSEQLEKSRALQEKISPIEYEISKHKQLEALEAQVIAAETGVEETLESLNGSIFIIDAIKAFNAKEAELQAEKVQGLFENLSIKLFDTVKTTGENKPTFVVQMDGKDYLKLSLSESIRAGLELRDVLSRQSEVVTPCFVDNAESITRFKEPNGQLILARVVAGQKLTIESEGI